MQTSLTKTRRKSHEVAEIRQQIDELIAATESSDIPGLCQQDIIRQLGSLGSSVSCAAVEACLRAMRAPNSVTPIHIGHYQWVRGRSKTRAVFVRGIGEDADPNILTNVVVVTQKNEARPDPQALLFRSLHDAFFGRSHPFTSHDALSS